jgi:hypothetical protein
MTEAEWLACGDPHVLLSCVKQHRGMRRPRKQRRQRLFSVACCRRIWSVIPSDRSRACVEVAERFADGQATEDELRAAEKEASAIWQADAPNDGLFACLQACYERNDGYHVSTTVVSAVWRQRATTAELRDPLGGRRIGACPSEELAQCGLIRCIFGNPFRPVAVDPSWLTSTVVALARGIYDDRAFDRLPILADALQDAGCDSDSVLSHCRTAGPHARGCWVVDLLLGKA